MDSHVGKHIFDKVIGPDGMLRGKVIQREREGGREREREGRESGREREGGEGREGERE